MRPSRVRFTVRRLMILVAILAVGLGSALRIRDASWGWLTQTTRADRLETASYWTERAREEEEWAERFWLASLDATLENDPFAASVLVAAADACLARAGSCRSFARWWTEAAARAPRLNPDDPTGTARIAGRRQAARYNADGRFVESSRPLLLEFERRRRSGP